VENQDVTAVMAKKEMQKSRGAATKILAFVVGISASVGPVLAARYGMMQARLEAKVGREDSNKEARTSYETLAAPLEQFRAAITILDWRVQRLENEHAAKESMGQISPEPLMEPALRKPVPQTLMEANAVAGAKE
jgi:hypothetical protein